MRLLFQAAFFSLLCPGFCLALQPADPQRVLVLYSDERLLPANVVFDHSFRTNLEAGSSRHVEFRSEFLDVSRFSKEAQQENQLDFLRKKHREYPPDLLIAVSASARAAFDAGRLGYVVTARLASDLLPAIRALADRPFISPPVRLGETRPTSPDLPEKPTPTERQP